MAFYGCLLRQFPVRVPIADFRHEFAKRTNGVSFSNLIVMKRNQRHANASLISHTPNSFQFLFLGFRAGACDLINSRREQMGYYDEVFVLDYGNRLRRFCN